MNTTTKLTVLFALASIALTGCRSYRQYSDVVKETYIHKYGVPMTQTDWANQGEDGQVVSLRKDGVTVSTSYAKGEIDGPTTYSFPNSSTVQFVETFAHGELVSRRENYPSGVPMREEIFEGGSRTGQLCWYEDGTPKVKETYRDGLLVNGEYRNSLNVLESRVAQGDGVRIYRTESGDLLSKDTIQYGQMIERVTYFAHGDPSTCTPYRNGAIHGTRLTFLPGGLPLTVESWEHGVQEGTTVVYQNGERIAEVPYVAGLKHGTEYRYRDGELLVEEVSWKNDLQHGQRKLHVDGDIKTEWYFEGALVSRSAYDRMCMAKREFA